MIDRNFKKEDFLKYYIPLFIFFFLFSCNGGGGGSNSDKKDVIPKNEVPSVDDPLNPIFSYFWFFKNIGQDTFEGKNGEIGQDVNLSNVHDEFTGKNIYIAVSDGRVDVDHEDIQEDIQSPYHRNYALGSTLSGWHGSNPTSSDYTDAHGTFIAGIIGAIKDNGKGGYGVAPDSNIVGFNFLDSDLSISKFIDQADSGDDDKINIFNYSYGARTCTIVPENSNFIEKVYDGVSNQRAGKGSIYVTSSGNDFFGNAGSCSGLQNYNHITYLGNSNFDQKKAYPYFITVAAMNSSGKSASYSTPGSNIWISAPGGDPLSNGMVSTDLEGCNSGYSTSLSGNQFDSNKNGLNPDCKYAMGRIYAGTSFAAPIVSGTIGLLLEANPDLSWRDVKHILALTADQVDTDIGNTGNPNGHNLPGHNYEQGWIENDAGFKFHNWYGFGRINIKNAVDVAKNYSSFLPEQKSLTDTDDPSSFFYDSGVISRAIPDNNLQGVTASFNVRHNFKIEAVQVIISLNHPWPYQVGIELISPSGIKSILKNVNTNSLDQGSYKNIKLLTNAFYGESSKGPWTLKLIDGQGGSTGTLINWKLNIWGHILPNPHDTIAPNPVSNISHPETFNSLTSTPTISFNSSKSEDVLRYEASIGSNPGETDIKDWFSIGMSSSFSKSGLNLVAGSTYYVNIRAIDENENISLVETSRGWVAEYLITVSVSYTYATLNLNTNGGTGYTAFCYANDTIRQTCNLSKTVDISKKSKLESAFRKCDISFSSINRLMSINCPESVNCYYDSNSVTTFTCISYCTRINSYVGGGTINNGVCSFNPP